MAFRLIFNKKKKVQVTKSIPMEHNLTIDWTEKIIPAQDEVKMEMIWTPQMDIACKETLQLKDNRNFRKDVMVILKSRIDKPMKQTRKFPTISSSFTTSHVRTMRLKSPGNSIKHKRNIGVGSAAQMQERQRQDRLKRSEATTATATATTTTTAMTTKIARNSFKPSSRDKGEISSSYTIVKTDNRTLQISPLSEMNLANQRQSAVAAAAAKIPQTNLNVSSPLLNNTTDDIPKENISPLTPNNVLDFIDNLNFTPATATATQTKDNLIHTLDNLAYLPTPINTTQISNVSSYITAEAAEDRQQLRPRKLTFEDLCGDGCVETPAAAANLIPTIHIEGFDVVATPNHQANVSGIVTNKTFDVKRSQDISFSNDSSFVNYSATGTGGTAAAVVVVVVNQTTTILCTPMGRTLTIIQEEDDSSQSISEEGQSQKDIQNVNVIVKRDIKLVGTPLRKHSESMQDLSWKSPQGKLAIQGSMPNLNEMDSIRSIEQNRYFHESGTSGTQNHRESSVSPSQGTPFKKNRSAAAESDKKICSNLRVPSNSDLNFNKNEILAQSNPVSLILMKLE